jgi:hypothetical protein
MFRDALRGQDQVNSEVHSEAKIERVYRWSWRPRLSELSNTPLGGDRESLEMQLEAAIE